MNTTLENALEWLRPLVEFKVWDFSVVWKLGNDSSGPRFIEFVGCCCSGGASGEVKDEKDQAGLFCKDGYYKHQVRTKACEALSKLPSFMNLSSGNHGDAVITTQPRWLRVPNNVDTNSSIQSYGTQVLIPVLGGLIELFSQKQIPKDEKIVEFILAHHNEKMHETLLEENQENYLKGHSCLSLTHTSIERSSSGSNPSIEYPLFDSHSSLLPLRPEPKNIIGKSAGPWKSESNDDCLKGQADPIPDSISKVGKGKAVTKSGKICVSKNCVTERNRRRRIQEGLHTLRALVPNISKMDKISILGDAIEYIGELEMKVKALQDELNEIEEEEIRKRNQQVKTSKLKPLEEGCITLPQKQQDSASHIVKEHSEVQLELHQIAQRDFVIKMFCDQKQGGFSRLIRKLDALGFRVVDANITTFRGKVLNILRLEANRKDAQLKTLRDSLIKLTETD